MPEFFYFVVIPFFVFAGVLSILATVDDLDHS